MSAPSKVEFSVRGIPATQGSKKGFYNAKLKRVLMVDDNKRNRPWRADVVSSASEAMVGLEPIRGPVRLSVRFVFPRPKGHFRGGKVENQLKPSAPFFNSKKPDCTKLVRSVEDALKGVVWIDDSQVVSQMVLKVYGTTPGADVKVEAIHDSGAN